MPWNVPEELIDQAAEKHGLTAVTDAYLRDDGTFVVVSGGQSWGIPVPAGTPTDTLPVPTSDPTVLDAQAEHSLPTRGSSQPASLNDEKPAVSPKPGAARPETAKPNGVRPLTGGSGHSRASGASPPSEAASEPPPNPPLPQGEGGWEGERDASDGEPPAETAVVGAANNCESKRSLDDFTIIPGVGPATAAKLHDLGFHTFADLRQILEATGLIVGLNARPTNAIRAWLKEHPP